jgi:mono/diheme cytochrome c family protein
LFHEPLLAATHETRGVHDRFLDIVLRGALRRNGMAGFADVLSEHDAEAIHAYVISAQRRAFEANRQRQR